ncbi:MAG TPA: carbohydrate-binding protein, partial [Planctomycetota bacterium]|nr:carbohydrate-binding protein [Planctomycetota bacterium]
MLRSLHPFRRAAGRVPEAPFRDELLDMERLEERALALGASFTVDPRRRARNVFPRFEENVAVLRASYRLLAADVRAGLVITPAAEWLLDNYHLVAAEVRDIRRHLPRGYYRQLPRLASRGHGGQARIHAMAVELLRHSDSRLGLEQLTLFVEGFQRVAPLTLGELWAWPSVLKIALVENLRRLADAITSTRSACRAADECMTRLERSATDAHRLLPHPLEDACVVQLLHRLREYGPHLATVRTAIDEHLSARKTTAEDAIRGEHQRQATMQVSMANSVNSLRLCAMLDWPRFVESVSLVERALQHDPAGAYPRMDFLSRDRQRQAVEDLAEPTGESQLRVARRAVESAREAFAAEPGRARATPADAAGAATPDAARAVPARAAHVGYHLIDAGRPQLEADVAWEPPLAARLRRFVFAHATTVYLLPIAALAALCVLGAAAYARHAGASLMLVEAAALLLLLPGADLAIAVVQRVVARAVPPRRLPRMDMRHGVPQDARTMVVVPTLIAGPASVAHLLEHLEVLALGNLDALIHFALLTDLPDADARERPGEDALLDAARAGIEDLNRRLGAGHADRCFLFHRERRWNGVARAWMGWERKRGKLEEFNRLLRGATDTSFTLQVGELSVLPQVRYVLTLDTDTRLPRDAARELIGVIAHPLNRPRFDPRSGRVTEGYGILQPRVSVTMASAAGSLFARTWAGHTGVDPYTTAVSDVYQDLFGEGVFTGKGLYDVDAFVAALDGRVPENALLSHDLFEGLYARTGLVTDVEVVDDYPASVLAHARRQHRWVRGDWQILWWLFPLVPTRAGLQRNRLPLIARWKILDNLRRSLQAPATIAALLAGWTLLPGSALAWTAMALAPLAWPVLLELLELPGAVVAHGSWRVSLRGAWRELQTAAARAALQACFLATQATDMLHAIAVTVNRLLFTHRRLLEWETAAASAQREGPPDARAFLRSMAASPAIALAAAAAVALARPSSLAVAWPLLAAWAGAPLLAFALSRPVPVRRTSLGADDRAFLHELARGTWAWFERFVGPEDNHLPPDNVQLLPHMVVAHRTSPTNIGMALLATLSAHDFG